MEPPGRKMEDDTWRTLENWELLACLRNYYQVPYRVTHTGSSTTFQTSSCQTPLLHPKQGKVRLNPSSTTHHPHIGYKSLGKGGVPSSTLPPRAQLAQRH